MTADAYNRLGPSGVGVGTTVETHHVVCDVEPQSDVLLSVNIGHRTNGSLVASVRFASGDLLTAEAGDPDLGFTEADTVLHDVAHTLLACRLGLGRSPVLERVVNLRPLTQEQVDLEEAAVFAIQAWCLSLRNEDPGPAIRNALVSLNRLIAGIEVPEVPA